MRLRRSLLFVPGDDERKIDRALAGTADSMIFDLEDAVAPERKAFAREVVVEHLRRTVRPERIVRVNAVGTTEYDLDVQAAVAGGADALLLPKCDGPEVAFAVAQHLKRLGAPDSLRLLALIESAAGLMALQRSWSVPRLDALCFGHVDIAREFDLPDADPNEGLLLHGRCQLAIAARAAGLIAIDAVTVDYRDAERCRHDGEHGRRLGYAGKFCIHPNQIAIVHRAYAPSAALIARAELVLAAWDSAQRSGAGVIAYEGEMIDAPVAARYRAILARATPTESTSRRKNP